MRGVLSRMWGQLFTSVQLGLLEGVRGSSGRRMQDVEVHHQQALEEKSSTNRPLRAGCVQC